MRGGASARDVLRAFVAQRAHVDAVQEMLSVPSRTGAIARCSSSMRPRAQVLPDRGHASTDADIPPAAASFACSSAA